MRVSLIMGDLSQAYYGGSHRHLGTYPLNASESFFTGRTGAEFGFSRRESADTAD
jgi:hypothetical protein